PAWLLLCDSDRSQTNWLKGHHSNTSFPKFQYKGDVIKPEEGRSPDFLTTHEAAPSSMASRASQGDSPSKKMRQLGRFFLWRPGRARISLDQINSILPIGGRSCVSP
ncbi:hypothetical protein, partial [Bradyrhizobium sp.]|uniref:hypothetical protein n=1 Tax=Bradyrhizobium sp. TaxID=376 RepID=UPI0025C2341E